MSRKLIRGRIDYSKAKSKTINCLSLPATLSILKERFSLATLMQNQEIAHGLGFTEKKWFWRQISERFTKQNQGIIYELFTLTMSMSIITTI